MKEAENFYKIEKENLQLTIANLNIKNEELLKKESELKIKINENSNIIN